MIRESKMFYPIKTSYLMVVVVVLVVLGTVVVILGVGLQTDVALVRYERTGLAFWAALAAWSVYGWIGYLN